MTDSAYAKSALAHVAMDFVPQLIRETLLEDSDFRDEYGLTTESVLSFGGSDVSIQQSGFFDAVRKALLDSSEEVVTDTKGHKWTLENTGGKGTLPRLSLSCCTHPLPTYLIALSPDRDIRMRSFDEDVSNFNLPSRDSAPWRSILVERSLEDEEVDAFRSEFHYTPVAKIHGLRSDIREGRGSVSTLVPPSRKYYERLVGIYDGSTTIRNYASGGGRDFLRQLTAWRPYDGFLISLVLSSHASLTDEIAVDQLSIKDLVRAYGFLEKHGDIISQLGAIEVGLRTVRSRPEIEQSLIRLIKQIRDNDVDEQGSGFRLLSALFCVVDGELSRIRLFAKEPPFYRRLAALTHASLLHRQLLNSKIDIDHFIDWASDNSGLFSMQSLADMRLEPRWDPELVVAPQLKAEFFGRIMISAEKFKRDLIDSAVFGLIIGHNSTTLQSLGGFPHPWLPGPLEGVEGAPRRIPNEIAKVIETQLRTDEVGSSSFAALINYSLIFGIRTDHAQLAADALKRANYRLQNIESKLQLVAILDGLSTVAAVTRSPMLAEDLRILVRKYRRDPKYMLSIQEVVKFCLSSAASHSDLAEWTEFVGEWLTELAFGDLKSEEGQVFYSSLDWLCHAVPELWVSCGRAHAALMAFNAK